MWLECAVIELDQFDGDADSSARRRVRVMLKGFPPPRNTEWINLDSPADMARLAPCSTHSDGARLQRGRAGEALSAGVLPGESTRHATAASPARSYANAALSSSASSSSSSSSGVTAPRSAVAASSASLSQRISSSSTSILTRSSSAAASSSSRYNDQYQSQAQNDATAVRGATGLQNLGTVPVHHVARRAPSACLAIRPFGKGTHTPAVLLCPPVLPHPTQATRAL